MRKILITLIVILLLVLGTLSYFVIKAQKRIDTYTDTTQQVFTIESGQGKDLILDNLYNANLIDSKLNSQLKIKRNELSFYAGDFGLTESMTDDEVLSIISNPKSNIDTSREFLITEGSTVDQIATDLAEFTVADDTQQEILDYWSDPEVLNTIIANYDFVSEDILDDQILYPLEGYFFPATYKVADDASLEEITTLFLDTMEVKLADINFDNTDYDMHQILTLASIIERETLSDTDKPTASGVFYNRLDQDMPLQSDITVLYAKQEHKEQVLYEDLEYESPYNTYLNKGLPPGPISTVSVASIDAAANPESNDYLYFFADQDTGELYFSKTIEEHEQIASEHAWDFEN